MIRRGFGLLVIAWALGFIWFAAALPQPAEQDGPPAKTDAIVVPTGSGGRIARGLEMLRLGAAREMLVTGVDPQVRPAEFQEEYGVSDRLMDCCVELGFSALDTRGNARETTEWMAERQYNSLRLVTADWHMRRTQLELMEQLPADIMVVRDAVRSEVTLWTLFLEYHKFVIVWLTQLVA